jgi:outer membrane receptor protein involved in Fe transport
VGLRHDDGRWLAAATVFGRDEDDVIDWARSPGDTVWVVQNAATGEVRGLELRAGWRHGRGHALELGYQYLDRELTLAAGAEARYALVVPRHHLTGRATVVLPANLDLTVIGRWLERTGGEPAFAEAAVFSARLRWRAGPFSLHLDGQNLGDRRYAEVPGVILPGRMVLGGAAYRF